MKDSNTKGKSKRSGRLLTFLLIIFGAVFISSAFMLSKEIIQSKKEKAAFDKMAQDLHTAVEKQENGKTAEELTLEYYKKLKQQNEHFVGWISIPGTSLDYPVVHTPQDIEYYLRRAFDGSYAVSGTPFLGEGCDINSTNVLIYGHRMNNDTMFTSLLDYAKKDYWENHKEIRFDTVDKLQTYEVFAAFYIDIPFENDDSAFHWYNYSGDIQGETFAEYVNQVKAHAYYDTGIEVAEGDKLITLTTCAYNDETQRFVVVAKLKQ
ncbi:MAG: class B sortase [Ruminococcaceae bacterium]|nr:class B sortase [Oscillospiraceae bacterium]